METEVISRQIELLKDNVVKKIFSGDTESSRELIARLIEETTNHEYKREDILESMVMENPYIAVNSHGVNSEVDTFLSTNDVMVNIEYNTTHYRELDIKNNSYVCNLTLRQIVTYKDYSNVKKIIQINLNYYDLFGDNEFIHDSVYIDKKTKKIRPNNITEIFDINLELLRKMDYNNIEEGEYGELKKSLFFLINNDKKALGIVYRDDHIMEEIMKKIKVITNDLDELFYYDKKELEKQRDERERREGREEGKEEKTIEVIKKMLEKNYELEDISEITGKSIEEIKEIQKYINN
jgi:predicted transposase/invertase (TIGR01784 family)